MKIPALLGIVFLGHAGAALAQDSDPQCPATIDVQQAIQKTPEGWSASVTGGSALNVRYALNNVSFFSGPPDKPIWSMPGSGKKANDQPYATWSFSPDSAGGNWVYCEYSNTSVTLVKRLADQVKSCTVVYLVDLRLAH